MKRQDLELEVTRMLMRRAAAFERLQGLANVRSVGIGLRVRRGKPRDELAFRVYVDVKVPRAELSPSDLIPESVEGIPTDVIQIGRAQKICWNKGTRPLVGGIEVSSSPFDTLIDKRGTLGCMVTTDDGKMAVLSNEHVLQFKTTTDKRIWQPHYDECLGFRCNKIGDTVDGFEDHFDHEGTSFWVDCAIAVLDSGIEKRFKLRRIINNAVGGPIDVSLPEGVEGLVRINEDGKVVSIRDEQGNLVDTTHIGNTAAALPGTIVWKIGLRSKLTAGIVDDPLGTVTDDRTGEVNNNLILIRALAGYESGDIPLFADEGDSGSLLLDLSNQVVGVVTGKFVNTNDDIDEGEETFIYACNINPVLARMRVSINASPTPPIPTAAVLVCSEEREEPDEVDFGERLHALERRVRATVSGPALIALIEYHAAEAHDLVNHRRAVTVVWHRHQGPAFVALFARSLSNPYGTFPSEANLIPLRSMLAAMGSALRQYGSLSLRSDLDMYEPWIIRLLDGCGSVHELLARLEASLPTVSQ